MLHIDAIDLAHTMGTVMSERERYKKHGDIIEHAKKYGVYDFHGTLDPGQADKWVETMEKALTTLQASDEENVSNVYGLMFDKANDSLTKKSLWRSFFLASVQGRIW